MDPSIMKLLEEDEDETMHSGADVEAFTAALNRDIEGDTSTSQPSNSDTAAMSQGSNQTSSQMYFQWQASSRDENDSSQSQQFLRTPEQQVEQPSEVEVKQLGSSAESQQQEVGVSQAPSKLPLQHTQTQGTGQEQKAEQNSLEVPQSSGMQISENRTSQILEPDRTQNPNSESQFSNMKKFGSQQTTVQDQANSSANRARQIPFGSLLPIILPELDKDRAMQLNTLYSKLRKNEIPKEGFVRLMRNIVGDQMLRLAVVKMHAKIARASHTGPNTLQSQNIIQQGHQKQSANSATQFTDPYSFSQLHQVSQSTPMESSRSHSATMQVQKDSGHQTLDSNASKSRGMEHLSDSHGMQVGQMPDHSAKPIHGLNKLQQQHLHFPQTSFPMHRTGSPYAGTNVNTPTTSVKPQPHDPQMRQVQLHHGFGSAGVAGPPQNVNLMSVSKFEKQNTFNDSKKVPVGSFSHIPSNVTTRQDSVPWQSTVSKEQKIGAYVKQEQVDQANDQQLKSPYPALQGSTSFGPLQHEQGNAVPGALNDELTERQSSRMAFSTSTIMGPPNSVSSSMTTPLDNDFQLPSAGSMPVAGITVKGPTKKPSPGQKKPHDPPGSSPPFPNKKQKVSGAFLDQSIEHLNDVTAVSGVNLREEEEQLFSVPKDDSRVSEASRRVVQEEEERLILQKIPLQKKLAEIMTKCGLKNLSNDVERCLSLCVEERLRGLISNLIRVSKQRVDSEKSRHRTVVTSDVRQQILVINRKAREEWEKKQAEAEKLGKPTEPDSGTGVDGDKEKDEGRVKSVKSNQEEDDKMRTIAANVAARAAVGGDDMFSKWQLMAEQARQKREGGTDIAPSSQLVKDANRKPLATTTVRNQRDNQGAGKSDNSAAIPASGTVRQFGRNQATLPQSRVSRTISVKDVLAVLEREPQMTKSTTIYRLYERVSGDYTAG
ncbi:hypothetical protein Nepgr_018297 [Nepenthes gracilis]|uniref:RST domain-containing protein n=1 Tax=Nepenthes gracilis TaxID=150966 RepID=A0AAD3XU64_NEPGR|nr:hypothetical protein Nepgr_018297 [Nepenthes gracilis]